MLVWMLAGLVILGNSGKRTFSGKGIHVNPIVTDKAEIFGGEQYKNRIITLQHGSVFYPQDVKSLCTVFPQFYTQPHCRR
jgi:hypothetical protein